MAIEDHGAGTQYVRARLWPRSPGWCLVALTIAALEDGALIAGWLLGSAGAAVAAAVIKETGGALPACHHAPTSLADADHRYKADALDERLTFVARVAQGQ